MNILNDLYMVFLAIYTSRLLSWNNDDSQKVTGSKLPLADRGFRLRYMPKYDIM
jgi:diphthamide biosynthesis methyltransferase